MPKYHCLPFLVWCIWGSRFFSSSRERWHWCPEPCAPTPCLRRLPCAPSCRSTTACLSSSGASGGRVSSRRVVNVGTGALNRVHQPRACVDSRVHLHAEVPLLAFPRLVHLGVAFLLG